MQRVTHIGAALVAVCLLTACPETDGPSLLGSGTTTGSSFLQFTNGMAAHLVIGQPDFTTANPGCSPAGFSNPRHVLIGASGKVWMVERGGSRVDALNALPTTSGVPFDFVVGSPSTSNCSNDGSSDTQLDSPEGVAESGNQLFVADAANRRIQVYSPIPTASLPTAVYAVGAADPNSSGSGICDATHIWQPRQIFATVHYLFVPDPQCHRVLIYSLPISGNQPTPVRVLGQVDFTSSASATTAGGMNSPWSVWSDETKIAVVDAGNHRVLLWDSFPTVDGQAADRVAGQADFTSGSAALAQNRLDFTIGFQVFGGVFFTGQQLAVADAGNNRVLIWNSWPSANGQNADTVLGQSDFVTGTSGTSQTTLLNPISVSVRGQSLAVTDMNNYRVMVWQAL